MPHEYMVGIWLFSLSMGLSVAAIMEQPHGNVHYQLIRNEINSFDLISQIMVIAF